MKYLARDSGVEMAGVRVPPEGIAAVQIMAVITKMMMMMATILIRTVMEVSIRMRRKRIEVQIGAASSETRPPGVE